MKGRRTVKILRYAARALILLLILAVNAVVIWRVFFSTKLPDGVKDLAVSEELRDAYLAEGDGLILRYQQESSITRGERSYGYFSVEKCVFIPSIRQVQIVFRYNDSTLGKVAADYGLPEIPEKGSGLFDVTLCVKDEDGNESRISPSSADFATAPLYSYVRYVFDGVSVEDATEGVFADVYFRDDVDYEKEAYGTLCLYAKGEKWFSYKLTADEKKLLK